MEDKVGIGAGIKHYLKHFPVASEELGAAQFKNLNLIAILTVKTTTRDKFVLWSENRLTGCLIKTFEFG